MNAPSGTKHTAWVTLVDSQLSFGPNGRVDRALIVSIKGSDRPLWVLGPDTQLNVQPVLRLVTDAEWNAVAAALRQGRASITWWESEGLIQRLIVTASWDPSKTKGPAAGFGIGFAVPMG